ncbi:hypothetical protein B0H13DRAFT_2393862 [Mycena leptocephala]|nr:hypothetical protein B0H13DRAFT_2393862 [Mycena leptocephala]
MQPTLAYVAFIASPHTATDFSSNAFPTYHRHRSASTHPCAGGGRRAAPPPCAAHDAAVLIACPFAATGTILIATRPSRSTPAPASLMHRDFGAHHPRVCVQRSRRPLFGAAASLFGCSPTTPSSAGAAQPPRSRAGLLDPLPILSLPHPCPIPRRPHERRGRGLRLPTSPPCSMPPPRVRIATRLMHVRARTQLRETAAAFHRSTPAASAGAGAGAGEDPEECCKNAESADLDLDLDGLRRIYLLHLFVSFPPCPFTAPCFITLALTDGNV